MTMPDIPHGEDYQPADEYDPEFTEAVLPQSIKPYMCDHDGEPPICVCVHDWRINWGNMPKVQNARATYLTG